MSGVVPGEAGDEPAGIRSADSASGAPAPSPRVAPVLEVSGVDDTGAEVVRHRLPHGVNPEQLLRSRGWLPVRATTVHGQSEPHHLVVEFAVRPGEGRPPAVRDPSRDPGLVLAADEEPKPRQRVAVYALCRSERGLLLTEFSDRTHAPGQWGLPGGGIDAGELPEAALHREIEEETSQSVRVDAFLGVHDAHWVGRAPSGRLEDLHAVRLLYLATCPTPRAPVVQDIGGTTWSAAWVPFEAVRQVALTAFWRRVIDTWWPAVVSG